MSYLTLDAGVEDFTQAVIAVWFRVPMASIQTAMGNYNPDSPVQAPFYSDAYPPVVPLNGVVPLVTFGRPQQTTVWTAPYGDVGSYSYTTMMWVWTNFSTGEGHWVIDTKSDQPISAQLLSSVGDYPLDPCFIGVECVPANSLSDGNPPQDTFVLKVNLQMDRADPSTFPEFINGGGPISDWVDYEYGSAPGYNFWPLTHNNYVAIWADGKPQPLLDNGISYPQWDSLPKSTVDITIQFTEIPADLRWPETFVLGGINSGVPDGSGNVVASKLAVTPDDWHVLILSLDLSKEVKTQGFNWDLPQPLTTAEGTLSAAQAWIAFDGQNITREDLSPYWPKGTVANPSGYADPNAILTRYAYQIATTYHQPGELDFYNFDGTWLKHHQQTPFPRFSYQSAGVPSAEAPFAIPSSMDDEDSILRVEMAEFHMWTGVTLDTSVDANIALFVTSEGRPNTHYAQTGPKDPKGQGMDDVLGTPVLRLHGSSDWSKGKNTGSLGLDTSQKPPKVLPDGQFTPTAKINPYKPNPSLSGYGAAPMAKTEIRLKGRTKA
jgi:hypothetical protein